VPPGSTQISAATNQVIMPRMMNQAVPTDSDTTNFLWRGR
jgi:hypothetical protein